MFGECSQKDVPPLVACAGWLSGQQLVSAIIRFPAVLLEELGDKSPPVWPACGLEQTGQIVERHRSILPTTASLPHDHLPSLPTVAL
jgi:hypothetical protein